MWACRGVFKFVFEKQLDIICPVMYAEYVIESKHIQKSQVGKRNLMLADIEKEKRC